MKKSSSTNNDNLKKLLGGDEYFTAKSRSADNDSSFAVNSGIAYKNKYAILSNNSKLASSEVVDVSNFKKQPVSEVERPGDLIDEFKDFPKSKDNSDDALEEFGFLSNGEELRQERQNDGQSTEVSENDDDEDFDKFFNEFMSNLKADKKEDNKKTDGKKIFQEQPKQVEKSNSTKKTKPATSKRKKKRVIDIDIISGGIGGDII